MIVKTNYKNIITSHKNVKYSNILLVIMYWNGYKNQHLTHTLEQIKKAK